MKKLPIFCSIILLFNSVFGTPKTVKVSNASDSTVKVCIYTSPSPDEIGVATGEFALLETTEEKKSAFYPYKYLEGYFIHAVVFLKNGDRIITKSHRVAKKDDKILNINITKVVQKPIDRAEVKRMQQLVDEEVKKFSNIYKYTIPVDGDASTGIQEYLGAIVIIDTSKNIIKSIYTARQLNISENLPLSGRSFQETYRITKKFAGDAAVSIPAAFVSNIDFSSGDLQEITLSCKTIGTVLLPTRPGVTPVSVLLDFDDKNVENIVGTIITILNDCENCILQQVRALLAHAGIAVNVKRYRKSDIAVSTSATNIVAGNGVYQYENNFDYFDIITPKVITLGFDEIDLKTNFYQTVLSRLNQEKSELVALINDQQLSIQSLQEQLNDINNLISKISPPPDDKNNK